ncbi:uncharacterized protein LOC134275454 [Saccostrea cucullata]|uniref:uncharacterized protein LOC134275454 n=1 Tax=Saccostrea cuccullata TaxID=36930 RepID=UPI002ED58690
MEKVASCAAFLLILMFVQESSCFPRSISKASFKPLEAKLQRNTAFKRQGPPPPPPPKPVWEIIGKTREDFINEHKDELTSEVRATITAEMEGIVENITRGMEEFARTLSCMVITMAQGTRSVDAGESLTDIKNDIVSEEEAEERELDDLFTYLGLEDDTKICKL